MSLHEPRLILETYLSLIRHNVREGIKAAQDAGLEVQIPTQIEIEMPLNICGLPVNQGEPVAARLKTILTL